MIYCIGGGGQAAEDIQGRMEESSIDLLYRRISRVGWTGVLLIYYIGGGGQAIEDIQVRMNGSSIDLLYRRRRAGC